MAFGFLNLVSLLLYQWKVEFTTLRQQIWVWFLVREDFLEKGVVSHSRILVWRMSWAEEPSGPQSMGLQRIQHNWAKNTFTFPVPSEAIFTQLISSIIWNLAFIAQAIIFIYWRSFNYGLLWEFLSLLNFSRPRKV